MPNSITRTYPKRIYSKYFRETNHPAVSPNSATIVTSNTTWDDFATSAAMPDWHYRIRKHLSATTSRETDTLSVRSAGYGGVYASYLRNEVGGVKTRFTSVDGVWLPPTRPSLPASYADADNSALSKFWKHAKSKQTAFRGLTTLGELTETLRMLRNPARSLRRGLDDYLRNVVKRSRRAKRSSLPGIVSDTWLEHVFGWSPLISDVKDAGEALNRRLNRFAGSYSRVSGLGTQESSSLGTETTNTGFGYHLQVRYRRRTDSFVSVRWYGLIGNECENPIAADMNLFGVSWTDIVPTAWELIPYSFLVDYFTNIGDILDAWSVRKSSIKWCARTVRMQSISTIDYYLMEWGYTSSNVGGFLGWIERYATSGDPKASRRYVLRQPKDPVFPSILLEIPGFGTKWINMSALLLSRGRARRAIYS